MNWLKYPIPCRKYFYVPIEKKKNHILNNVEQKVFHFLIITIDIQ